MKKKLSKEQSNMRILIVDDMTNMRRTIRNMLLAIGYNNFEEADDGDTALDKLKVGKFQFVISDWNMPRMPGIELLMATKKHERLKDTPFLMITAENWEEEIAEAAEIDVDGYIIKPFVSNTLENKIAEIIKKRKNPSEGEIHYKLGFEYIENNDYDTAIEEFDFVLGIKPDSAKTLTGKGLALFKKGRLSEAKEVFKQAIDYNPRYVKAVANMAALCEEEGNLHEAIEYYKNAILISPRIAERQIKLADLLVKDKQADEAIKILTKALEVQYIRPQIILALAELFAGTGKIKESVNNYVNLMSTNKKLVMESLDKLAKNKKVNPSNIESIKKSLNIAN